MSLEQLWAGWRNDYVVAATENERTGSSGPGCVFCRIADSGDPSPDNGVVWRGPHTLAVLNLYPYASGHLLIVPRRHLQHMDELTPDESAALWRTTTQAVAALTKGYSPDGLNMGANLGRAAGAGIPAHLHIHVLPRWSGDTNFMTTVAGTRVMPQSMTEAWAVVHGSWPDPG